MARFGLRQRFILLIFSLFVILFTVVVVLQVSRTAVTERNILNEQSRSFATLATKPIGDAFLLYKDSGSVRIEQQVTKFTDLNPDVSGVAIVDTQGKTQFSLGKFESINADQAASFEPIYVTKNKVIRQVISPLIEDYGVHRYAIAYYISDARLIDSTQRTVGIILLISVLAFASVIIFTYWLVNRFFLSPVRHISAKALNISAGNLEDQITVNRNDEIGDLATAVNTMANSLKADITKLQEADRLKSEFITISSHNLRTPLTVIKGDLEMMREMGVPEQLDHMITDVADSAAHLNTFIEDLLAISSMESGKLARSEMEAAPIKELLERIAADYSQVAKKNNLQFNVDLHLGEENVKMSKHLLKMAFVNVIENAFKFTKEGSVGLKAMAQDDKVIIRVVDTGIGIAAEELPKLFTKFHRGTSVMQYDYEGTGIGLYLTKLIINDHAGTIEVESHQGQGSTFTVTLPVAS